MGNLPCMSDESTRAPELSRSQMIEIAHRLRERGVSDICPSCARSMFAIVPFIGYHNLHNTAQVLNGQINEPQQIPVVVRICGNCGFVATHSLGTIGLPDLKPGEVSP